MLVTIRSCVSLRVYESRKGHTQSQMTMWTVFVSGDLPRCRWPRRLATFVSASTFSFFRVLLKGTYHQPNQRRPWSLRWRLAQGLGRRNVPRYVYRRRRMGGLQINFGRDPTNDVVSQCIPSVVSSFRLSSRLWRGSGCHWLAGDGGDGGAATAIYTYQTCST
jgi:hypothetical protein